MLVDPQFAPDLEYLDVSNQRQVSQRVLKSFLDTHSKIKCVGLINVPLCDDFDCAKYPHIKVNTQKNASTVVDKFWIELSLLINVE